MTITLPVQPLRPIRGGLAQAAMPLVDADGQPIPEEQWRQGFTGLVDYRSDDSTFLWPVGCGLDPELAEKPDGSAYMEPFTYRPVILGGSANCGPNDNTPIGDIAVQRAQRALDRNRWSQLAGVLFNGHDGTGPDELPNMLTSVQIPLGFDAGNPNTIRETLSGMLDLFCDCGESTHVFYVPLSYQPYFDAALPGFRWNDERGLWQWGQFFFVFDCFPNLGPDTIEGATPTATDGSEVWIYLAPRPMVALSDEVVIQARNVRQNERLVIAEQPAILVFDTSCVSAAKALIA